MKQDSIPNVEGLTSRQTIANTHVSRRFWSEHERNVMCEMFADNYTEMICNILNRSYCSVSNQAFLMSLKKSEAFTKMELERQAARLRIVGVKNRYNKGREPENKGKPMSKELYEKCKQTMFKKGHLPHNSLPDFSEVLRKDKTKKEYVMIKVPGSRRLVYTHIYLWEIANNTKLQKGHNIVFKDGNTANIEIDNLECISNEELMLRNSKHHYPIEIIPTLININKLKKKIHEKQNG